MVKNDLGLGVVSSFGSVSVFVLVFVSVFVSVVLSVSTSVSVSSDTDTTRSIQDQYMMCPPSTTIVCPETNPDKSDSR